MHPEQEAFEKAIDANPLDAVTHGAYADWLDEHDQPDEAAFRRAMGEWVQRGSLEMGKPGAPGDEMRSFEAHEPTQSVNLSTDESGRGFTHTVYHAHLPYWANGMRHVTENNHRMTLEDPAIAYHPNIYWYHWRGYRPMEEGLRRAFMANRRNQQFSRRLSAYRACRKSTLAAARTSGDNRPRE